MLVVMLLFRNSLLWCLSCSALGNRHWVVGANTLLLQSSRARGMATLARFSLWGSIIRILREKFSADGPFEAGAPSGAKSSTGYVSVPAEPREKYRKAP